MDLDRAIETAEQQPAAYVLAPVQGDYLYKGACRRLQARLKDHRAGRVGRTKKGTPVVVTHMLCGRFRSFTAWQIRSEKRI